MYICTYIHIHMQKSAGTLSMGSLSLSLSLSLARSLSLSLLFLSVYDLLCPGREGAEKGAAPASYRNLIFVPFLCVCVCVGVCV